MRYFAIFALLLSLAVPAVAPAQARDAASLLALHHQYVGWQFGDGTFTSMREWGNVVNTKPDPGATPRPPAPLRTLVRGIVFRETEVNPDTGRAFDSGFTGNVFWQSDDNGFTHPVIGDEQKYEISFSLLVNEATTQLTGALQSPTTIAGTSYPVVRVSPTAGFPIDLAVDPKTGAYVRAVIDAGGDYETTIDVVSYKEVEPGKRVMDSYRLDGSHYTIEWSKFMPNVPITDNELRPPPQTAIWTFSNPNPFPIDLRHNSIIVTASINGVVGNFLVDTGSSGILLTSAFAKKAHLRRAASSIVCGVGGCPGAETDIIDSLVIGDNTLSNVAAVSSALGNHPQGINLSLYNRGNFDETIDGLLGYDLLGGAIVKLDFGAGTMSILDPSKTDLTSQHGAVVAVDLSGGQPQIPMTLNDAVTVKAVLDTGDALGIGYGSDLIYKYHVHAMRSGAEVSGVGGYALAACGSLGKISIGKISYEGERACDIGMRGTDVLMGFDFLRHFNMVLDYPQGIIIMDPLQGTF